MMSFTFDIPQRLLWFSLLLPAFVVAHAEGQDNKAPIPDAAAQKTGLQLVTDVFREEYAEADTVAEKKKLARRMLETAKQTNKDVAARYVLLRVARDIAVEAVDVEAAVDAVDSIGRWYQVDPFAMKLDVFSQLARSPQPRSQRASLFGRLGSFFDEAIRDEKYESALRIASIETELAGQLHNAPSRIKAQSHRETAEKLHKRYVEVQQAYARLKDDPVDPAANLTIGIYLCFERGDWNDGLAALALCGDELLRKAATRDLAGPESLADQVQLADEWWEAAEDREGDAKTGCLLRAGVWYEKAQKHGPKGLMRVKIEKRLAEIPKAETPDKRLTPTMPKELAVELPGGVKMEFVLIPAGEFVMGSPDAERQLVLKQARIQKDPTLTAVYPREGPQHRVRISRPFYLGKYEVTQAQWATVMGSNPTKLQHPRHPVARVSWNDATLFCRKLSTLEERTYRLPTEAEWEYACRAATSTAFHFGPVPNGTPLKCAGGYPFGIKVRRPNPGGAAIVGSYAPNAWGLYDMHGNVHEWCADWYDEAYYARSPKEDPVGASTGTLRVYRGGSWGDEVGLCRSASRYGFKPDDRSDCLGFRVLLAPRVAATTHPTNVPQVPHNSRSTPVSARPIHETLQVSAKTFIGHLDPNVRPDAGLHAAAKTKIWVAKGQEVTVVASGSVKIGPFARHRHGPDVLCVAIGEAGKLPQQHFKGKEVHFQATHSGFLFLGIDDTAPRDNKGGLTVEVDVR